MDENQTDVLEAVQADLGERLTPAAEQAVEAVKAGYVAQGHVVSGQMVRNVYAIVNRTEGWFKIVVPDFYAAFLEFGTAHQPARHPLANIMAGNMEKTAEILGGTE